MARVSRGRLAAAAVGAACLVAAGCGGADDTAVPCDDAGFRNQSEELYVTIATAQNAQLEGAPATAAGDLAKAVRLLRSYLDAHPPCDAALRELEGDEREALARLDRALATLGRGDDAAKELDAAVTALGQVEEALR